jgi:hypothetical protein
MHPHTPVMAYIKHTQQRVGLNIRNALLGEVPGKQT